jgi:hypothetical protein
MELFDVLLVREEGNVKLKTLKSGKRQKPQRGICDHKLDYNSAAPSDLEFFGVAD